VNLANLQPVLRQGASARGRVTGYVDAGPIVGTATLTETAIQLGDGIGFDRVDGRIEFGNDIVELHDLAVRGARSDCVFNVIYEDNRWDAVARGARFDLDALFELQDSLANLGRAWGVYEPATADSRSLWDDPIVGDATITVDSVHYGRGQLQDVNARIIGDGSSFRVRDLHARPGTGAVTGTIAIVPGDDHDAVVRSAFTWEDVDTAVVDSLFSQADRGVYGTISGELTFDAPMGNVKDMLATGTGTLSWNAREGSLGKLGVATKLLAALKSTEIINLRAPVLRDRGLVYYTFDGSADIVGGRATLGTTMLDGGAYKMVPTGTVNFAEDTTDVTVSVGLLQSVGNVVERVPIVGGVVTGLTTDNVRVAVKLTGSPYDLRASLLGATGKSIVRTPVDIGENVVRGLGRGFRNLVPRGNGNKTRENRATDQNESTPDSE